MRRKSGPPIFIAHVAAVGAILALTAPAFGQAATTTASAAIVSPASETGASVVVNVLSQTNIALTVNGPAQAVTSVSVPQALNVVGSSDGSTDIGLPTIVTPLGGTGTIGAPNAVAMSVGANSPAPEGNRPADKNNQMLVVIQYN